MLFVEVLHYLVAWEQYVHTPSPLFFVFSASFQLLSIIEHYIRIITES
jgi:hypothetical protein